MFESLSKGAKMHLGGWNSIYKTLEVQKASSVVRGRWLLCRSGEAEASMQNSHGMVEKMEKLPGKNRSYAFGNSVRPTPKFLARRRALLAPRKNNCNLSQVKVSYGAVAITVQNFQLKLPTQKAQLQQEILKNTLGLNRYSFCVCVSFPYMI